MPSQAPQRSDSEKICLAIIQNNGKEVTTFDSNAVCISTEIDGKRRFFIFQDKVSLEKASDAIVLQGLKFEYRSRE